MREQLITLRRDIVHLFKGSFPCLIQRDLRSLPSDPVYYEDEMYRIGFVIEVQGVVFRWHDLKTCTNYGGLIFRADQTTAHLIEAPKVFRRRQAVIVKVARVFGPEATVEFQQNTSTIVSLVVRDSDRLRQILDSKKQKPSPWKERPYA